MPKRIIKGIALAIVVLAISMLAVTIPKVAADNIYDINGDGKVDVQDVAMAAGAFGTVSGHPKWNAKADVNSDGKIDIVDLGLVAMHFGEHSP